MPPNAPRCARSPAKRRSAAGCRSRCRRSCARAMGSIDRRGSMLRDRLLARLADMGNSPDHQRLAAEVLGIRGAPPELARRLVAQALVLEDRRDEWKRIG